jgi:hypothetical protein
MYKYIAIFFLIILISSPSFSDEPKIKVHPSTTIDLGDIYQGQKIGRTVTVMNIGDDTLKITGVKAQCGCTATLIDKKEVAPNDSAKLDITFDSQSWLGKVTKQVYITSNDTSNSKITLQLTANIIQILKLNPAFFGFDNTKVDSEYVRTVTITNPSQEKTVNITSVNTKLEHVKVTLLKNSLMPGEQTQMEVLFKPVKTGSWQGTVEVTTDHPLQPKFEIKVYIWVSRR